MKHKKLLCFLNRFQLTEEVVESKITPVDKTILKMGVLGTRLCF